MTIYQKVLSVFGLLRDSINRRAARTEIAPSFDTGVTYTVGRMVVYNSVLYRCTTQHTGAWNADHFEETTVDAVIKSSATDGVVNILASSWMLNYVVNGDTLAKDACNILNISSEGNSPTLYLPDASENECRQFAICLNNHSFSWSGTIYDNYTGSALTIKYYPDWTQTTLDSLIKERMSESEGGNTLCIRLYEIYRGMFTVMNIY